MYCHMSAVFVLVAVAPIHIVVQAIAGADPLLKTTYEISRTQNASRVFLRLEAYRGTVPSLALTLQTDLAKCMIELNGKYTGEALQANGTYSSQGLRVTAHRTRKQDDGVSAELLNMVWWAERKTFKIVTPAATMYIAELVKGSEKWWKLWAWDSHTERQHPALNNLPPHPEEGGAEEGWGILVRAYPAGSGFFDFGINVDAFLEGEQHNLLNLASSSNSEKLWKIILQIPLLSVALECEYVWKREAIQVAVMAKSSMSGASLEFVHLDMRAEKKGKHMDNDADVGDFPEPQSTDVNDVCHSSTNSLEESWRKQPGHEEDHLDVCSKADEDARLESLPSGATHEIRQSITSSVFNYSSNMTTFPWSDGGQSIRILQSSHLVFCPRLSWTLNQVFQFRQDWSGWEYVVMEWDWGNMVVRGEWGTSLLQWYQKTFAFSFDKDAPLPSTHVVLDFRDWRSYKLSLKWPVQALDLTSTIIVEHDRKHLLLEEVNEFLGEGSAIEVARVELHHSSLGLTITSTFNTSRIQELQAAANLALQAITFRDVCGEVSAHTAFEFLDRLLGQLPARLWNLLMVQGRHFLLESAGGQSIFHQLWEVMEEEMETAGGLGDVLQLACKALKQTGVEMMSSAGELKVFLPAEWLGFAQHMLAWAGGATRGQCKESELVECLLEALGWGSLKPGGHLHPGAL